MKTNKAELRSRIIEELRLLDDSGPAIPLGQRKQLVAEKLGITLRWLNMVLNLTPHWSQSKATLEKKAQREQSHEQLAARGQRPGYRSHLQS